MLRFVVRRFGRLWPLHIATAVLFYVVGGLSLILTHSGVFAPTGTQTLSIVTMTQGLDMVSHSFGNAHASSTGDEFYVYVLFASICLILRRGVQVTFALGTPKIQVIMAISDAALMMGTCVIPSSEFFAHLVFSMLIASLITDSGPLASLLQTSPMQYLGRISYAIYLRHAVFAMLLTEWLLHGNYAFSYQLTGAVALLFASFALTHFMLNT